MAFHSPLHSIIAIFKQMNPILLRTPPDWTTHIMGLGILRNWISLEFHFILNSDGDEIIYLFR